MKTYLVYRHGANAANQGWQFKCPVALVEAKSATEACETIACFPGTLYATSALKLAPSVHAYNNQSFTARVASQCPTEHVRRVQEAEASEEQEP